MLSRALLSFVSLRLCSTLAKDLIMGATASMEKTISAEDVRRFSELTGDWNPIHHPKENAVVHGAFLNGLVSGLIGTKLPGPGTLLLKQTLRFPNPCYVGDTVKVTVEVTDVRRVVSCKFNVTSAKFNNVLMEGDAMLLFNKNGKN